MIYRDAKFLVRELFDFGRNIDFKIALHFSLYNIILLIEINNDLDIEDDCGIGRKKEQVQCHWYFHLHVGHNDTRQPALFA